MGSANIRFVRGDLRKALGVSDKLEYDLWLDASRGTTTGQWLGHCKKHSASPEDG